MNTQYSTSSARRRLDPQVLKLGCLLLVLTLLPLAKGGEAEEETKGKFFSVVAFTYRPMPERLDRHLKFTACPAYDHTSKMDNMGRDFSYTTSDGHYRIYVFKMKADRTQQVGFVMIAHSLKGGGNDVMALVNNPEDLDSNRLKACLELIPHCAASSTLSEGYPLTEDGGLDIILIFRDLGKVPVEKGGMMPPSE